MVGVQVDRDPPFRMVKLDTGRHNVLRLETVRALKDALTPDLEAPVLMLRGRSDSFCAGLDNATLGGTPIEREELLAAMGELLLAIMTSPTRVVAICEGHAVAAGAMLLLAADIRIGATGSYKLGFTEPRLGMPLPELPIVLAEQRLDPRCLHEVTVVGRTLGPAEAESVGFLDVLVEREELEETAQGRGRELAQLSEAAYGASVESLWGPTIERIRRLVAAQNATRDAATLRARSQ